MTSRWLVSARSGLLPRLTAPTTTDTRPSLLSVRTDSPRSLASSWLTSLACSGQIAREDDRCRPQSGKMPHWVRAGISSYPDAVVPLGPTSRPQAAANQWAPHSFIGTAPSHTRTLNCFTKPVLTENNTYGVLRTLSVDPSTSSDLKCMDSPRYTSTGPLLIVSGDLMASPVSVAADV
jgi:hypothetical protein